MQPSAERHSGDDLQEIFHAQDARRILRQAVRAEMARWPLGAPIPTGPGERIVTRLGVAVVAAFLAAALGATSLDYGNAARGAHCWK